MFSSNSFSILFVISNLFIKWLLLTSSMNFRKKRQEDIQTKIMALLSRQELDIHAQAIIESIPEYSHNTILKYLLALEGQGKITSRQIGNAKLYKLASDSNE